MKFLKNVTIFVFIAATVFLTSCGKSKEPVIKEPVITVNGSDETVIVNEEYHDKGAVATSPSGAYLNVIVDNKVDTSKIGDYQVIYTVYYNASTYYAIRNVEVIEPPLNEKETRMLIGSLAIKKYLVNPESLVFVSPMRYSDDSGWGVYVQARNAGNVLVYLLTEIYEGKKAMVDVLPDTYIYDPEYNVTFHAKFKNSYLELDPDPNVNTIYINYYIKLSRLPR